MALFEKTMKMFSPFPTPEERPQDERADKPKEQAAPNDETALRELNERLNALQQQIETLTNKKKG